MDLTEIAQTATCALESAKSAHHQLDELEAEIKDIRSLTTAMATVNQKVDNLTSDVDEIKADVKLINSRPGRWWDTLVAAAIGAVTTGLIMAIINLIK